LEHPLLKKMMLEPHNLTQILVVDNPISKKKNDFERVTSFMKQRFNVRIDVKYFFQ